MQRADKYPVLSPAPCWEGYPPPQDWSHMRSCAHLNPGMGRAREGCCGLESAQLLCAPPHLPHPTQPQRRGRQSEGASTALGVLKPDFHSLTATEDPEQESWGLSFSFCSYDCTEALGLMKGILALGAERHEALQPCSYLPIFTDAQEVVRNNSNNTPTERPQAVSQFLPVESSCRTVVQ